MISEYLRISVLSLLLCGYLAAQDESGFEHPLVNRIEPGVRAAGMGGAYRAIADDFSAVYYNPAGITQIKRFEVSTSLLHSRHYTTATRNNHSLSLDNKATRFGNLGLVAPYPVYRGALVFAAGLLKTHSFNKIEGLESPATGRFTETPDGGLSQWTMACGLDLSPAISSGIALNLHTGNNFIEYNAYTVDTVTTYFNDITDLSYSGVNASFGLLVKSGNHLKWGLTVTTPTVITEEGIQQWSDDTDPNFTNPSTDSYIIENTMVLPFVFSGGAALYTPWLLASFDAEYIDWEQLRYNDKLDGEHREVINLACGVEGIIPGPGIKVRAGYAHKPVVYKYYTGVTEERRTLSFGSGFLVDKVLAIDIAYTLRFWQTEYLEDLPPIVQDNRGHLIQLSGAYRF